MKRKHRSRLRLTKETLHSVSVRGGTRAQSLEFATCEGACQSECVTNSCEILCLEEFTCGCA